jgi:hypothetical protein
MQRDQYPFGFGTITRVSAGRAALVTRCSDAVPLSSACRDHQPFDRDRRAARWRGVAIGWRMRGPRRAEVQPVAPRVTGIIAAHHAGHLLPCRRAGALSAAFRRASTRRLFVWSSLTTLGRRVGNLRSWDSHTSENVAGESGFLRSPRDQIRKTGAKATDFSRGPALKYLKNFMAERPFCA